MEIKNANSDCYILKIKKINLISQDGILIQALLLEFLFN